MMTHTHTKQEYHSRLFKRTAAMLVVLAVGCCPLSVHAFDLVVGTAGEGTLSHHAGRLICRMVHRQWEEINCAAVPAPDDIHNLTNLQGGSLDIALVDSRMLGDAINKAGYFEFFDISYENLRVLFGLYRIPINLVVRDDAGIDSLADLKGKRINVGAPRSAQRRAMETILRAKGWSKKDFRLVAELPASQSQDSMAFCHDTVQAMAHVGVHPDPALQQLFTLCGAHMVNMNDGDIEKLVADNPAFSIIELPAKLYPSLAQPVATFGTRMVVVTSENLDEQTAYQVMEAVDAQQAKLRNAHPALAEFSLETASREVIGAGLHPGAVRYLAEPR
jgi:TRAP transporter TAXI family solute receptor